jgi:hypothetical protein
MQLKAFFQQTIFRPGTRVAAVVGTGPAAPLSAYAAPRIVHADEHIAFSLHYRDPLDQVPFNHEIHYPGYDRAYYPRGVEFWDARRIGGEYHAEMRAPAVFPPLQSLQFSRPRFAGLWMGTELLCSFQIGDQTWHTGHVYWIRVALLFPIVPA